MKQQKPHGPIQALCRHARTARVAFAIAIAIALLFGHIAAAYGAGETMASAMAEAMGRMMQAMGSVTNKGGGQGWSMPSIGQGFPSTGMMPYGAMMPGMTNWGMPFQGPTQMFGMPDFADQLGNRFPDSPLQGWNSGQKGWPGSPFEGLWEGVSGELVIVQGDRFRIYAPGATYVDGIVKVQGDRLALYNPADQQARPFDYAMKQGRLVLRDDAGQLFLYRRLVLDPERPAETTLGER